MKRYRITKRFVDTSGNVLLPQELEAKDGEGYCYVRIEGRLTESIIIYPSQVLHFNSDWLEEVKEVKVDVDKLERVDPENLLDEKGDVDFIFLSYKLNQLIDELNKLKSERK